MKNIVIDNNKNREVEPYALNLHGLVYTLFGIQFEMKDGSHLALYISDHPVQFERGPYFEEKQEAQQIIDTIKRSM